MRSKRFACCASEQFPLTVAKRFRTGVLRTTLSRIEMQQQGMAGVTGLELLTFCVRRKSRKSNGSLVYV